MDPNNEKIRQEILRKHRKSTEEYNRRLNQPQKEYTIYDPDNIFGGLKGEYSYTSTAIRMFGKEIGIEFAVFLFPFFVPIILGYAWLSWIVGTVFGIAVLITLCRWLPVIDKMQKADINKQERFNRIANGQDDI